MLCCFSFPAFLCLDDHHREKNTIKNLMKKNPEKICLRFFPNLFHFFFRVFQQQTQFSKRMRFTFFSRFFLKLLRIENMRLKILEWLYFILFNYLHYDTKLHFTLVRDFGRMKRILFSQRKTLKIFSLKAGKNFNDSSN